MLVWLKSRTTRRTALLSLLVLLVVLVSIFWTDLFGLFRKPSLSASKILMLVDCDDDFRAPPFEDSVIAYNTRGRPTRKVADLNICQTIGGGRMLAASPDGAFFLVCENVGNHLSAYRSQSGERLWSLNGEFTSVTVGPDGMIYGVISAGTIYGDKTLVIDPKGQIIKQTKMGGFDLALDAEQQVLWLVGANIKKCDLQLTVLRELDPIPWCASSVDINPDGSIWVAEREHRDVAQSTNRLLKISPGGLVLQTVNLDFSPSCLRVDRTDGTFWVTGGGGRKPLTAGLLESIEKRTGRLPIGKKAREFLTRYRAWSRTEKYDANGKLLYRIGKGGHTLDLNATDRSVWIAARDKKLYHYSRDAKALEKLGGVSDDQKYVVILPGAIR